MSNNPKRQHYVPKFYLNGFSDDSNKIHAFFRDTKKFKPTYAKDLSIIPHYYTIEKDGNKNYTIENFLGTIESDAAPVFRKLSNCEKLNAKELQSVHNFMAIQTSRGPGYRNAVDKFESKLIKRFTDMQMRRSEIRQGLAESFNNAIGKKITEGEILEMYDEFGEKLTIEMNPARSLHLMLEIADTLAVELQHFNHMIIYCCPKDVQFITSDMPIISANYHTRGYYPGASMLGYRDTSISMPIDKNTLLVLSELGPDFDVREVSRQAARSQNCHMASLSYGFACSSNMALLNNIVNKTKLMTKEPKEMFSMG